MQIPLNQFEQHIDETILERGLAYFKKGHVHQPHEITPGKVEAIVEGTENYTVQLSLSNGVISGHVCDCPYDMGPVCKHVVAVIFYLQQDDLELDIKPKMPKKDPMSKTKKTKTPGQQVETLPENTGHDQLKQFVREKVAHKASSRDLLLSHFAQYNADESIERYVNQVHSMLDSAYDDDGYIGWLEAHVIGNSVETLLDKAWDQIEKRKYKKAVFIATAVIEELTQALDHIDDSAGYIGTSIENAYEILFSLACEPKPEKIRNLLMEYCFWALEKHEPSGWDWYISLLEIAGELVKTEEETEQILSLIDRGEMPDYHNDKAQVIKYHILLSKEGESAAEKYLQDNITNSNLRMEAIDNALKNKNYDKAKTLAQDGVNYDIKDRPGLGKQWYDYLLKIAQAQKDTEKIIEYARLLLIVNSKNDQDYYKILKQHVKPKEWRPYVEGLVHALATKVHWPETELIAYIFITEKWWDRLLDMVRNSGDLKMIERYEEYLSKHYLNELVDLYAKGIVNYLKNSKERDHYQNACRYIRHIIKLGAKDKANEIINYLRTQYPKRKALMDELNKV